MSGTVHVSVRLPGETLALLDAEAARLNRSRSWVIAWILGDRELYRCEPGIDIWVEPERGRVRTQGQGKRSGGGGGTSVAVSEGDWKRCPECMVAEGMLHQKGCTKKGAYRP